MSDPVEEFKAKQREAWTLGNFGDAAVFTTPVAAHLVRFAGIQGGHNVLDVGTGTGVVAITAARQGAIVTGIDLTPGLLEQAKRSAPVAGLLITWKEGDAESLPFQDATFDVVLSEFGHMFAPRPEVATREMLRVLKPGGRIAFATWPPESFAGRSFTLSGKYLPPSPGVAAPAQWGDVNVVTERLGAAVTDLFFERGVMAVPALSPQHFIAWQTATIGPSVKMLAALEKTPEKRDAYLKEYSGLTGQFFADNIVRYEYLLTRATKA